jgi:hypothetical protein
MHVNNETTVLDKKRIGMICADIILVSFWYGDQLGKIEFDKTFLGFLLLVPT